MKFHHKEKLKAPRRGDCRVKTKFAFLPIRIGNETRWLERVEVSQKYSPLLRAFGYNVVLWINEDFADNLKF